MNVILFILSAFAGFGIGALFGSVKTDAVLDAEYARGWDDGWNESIAIDKALRATNAKKKPAAKKRKPKGPTL
jgi:hypothetical protein